MLAHGSIPLPYLPNLCAVLCPAPLASYTAFHSFQLHYYDLVSDFLWISFRTRRRVKECWVFKRHVSTKLATFLFAKQMVEGSKACFFQLRSYRDEIETRKREEIPFFLRIVPRGVSQWQRNHRQHSSMPHSYVANRPTCLGLQRRLKLANLRLRARYRNPQATADHPTTRRVTGHFKYYI